MSSPSSQAAKPALNVVDLCERVVAKKQAEQAQRDVERTRLESLTKALKERCFLLEQCLVQERKDTHRLRHELNIVSRSAADDIPEAIQEELQALRELVKRQAGLIGRMHTHHGDREEAMRRLKSQ